MNVVNCSERKNKDTWMATVLCRTVYEPRHDKTNKMSVRPAKTQISPGIRLVWSESLLSAWKLGSLSTQWAHSEDSDQTGRMPRLIWVFTGRTLFLLVLSCRGSIIIIWTHKFIWKRPRGRAVSAPDFGSRGRGFESRWRRDSSRT